MMTCPCSSTPSWCRRYWKVSPSSGYELMHESGFPVLRIESRMVVPKEKFIQWVEEHVKEGDRK